MNREALELVTAYVDGEATAAERARVEADPEMLAEVERLRSVRTALHDVETPTAAARERAIAAALAVFDGEIAAASAAAADATVPTTVVPLEQRRRTRWVQGLGAAAAAVVIAVGGAVIATRSGGDDDGTTADEQRVAPTAEVAGGARPDTAPEAPTDVTADADAEAGPTAQAPTTMTTTGPEIMMAAPATTILGAPAEAADAATADTGATDADTAAADAHAAPPAAAAPTTSTARFVVITSEDGLVAFAEQLKEPPVVLGDAEDACADRLLKADAMFGDSEGEQRPVVVVALDADRIGLLTLDDCHVVLDADVTGG